MKKQHDCFVVSMAGLSYKIKPLYQSTYNFLKDYLSDSTPAINVTITEDDIIQEINKEKVYYYVCKQYDKESQNQESHQCITIYKEINKNRIETVILYRKIIEASIAFGVFFMHGAVISVNNYTFMFTAPSGTGKTTHIKKWIDCIDNSFIINGDKPLIRITDSSAIACGTPWCGNENLGVNTTAPLTAIILMERNENNYMEEISFESAFPFLVQQIYIPDNIDIAKKELELLSQLKDKVRFFRFSFNNFKSDCLPVSYNTLMASNTPISS